MYDFRKYAKEINERVAEPVADNGFEVESTAKMVAVNFDAADIASQMTVVCSGAPRGGSSILPFLLQNMGLSMGTFDADNYEDVEFLRNRTNVEKLTEIIATRNASDKWGFKIPALRRGQYGFFDQALRNPVYIFIMRNPMLMATSLIERSGNDNYSSDRRGFANALQDCIQSYVEFVAFMRQTRSPCIMMSMEQIRGASHNCVSFLNDQLALGADDTTVTELAEQIKVSGYKPRG